MMTINAERGEVGITLDGKEYPMRASWEAQEEIESALGTSLEHLYTVVPSLVRGLTLKEKACIVTAGIKAAGKQRSDPMLLKFQEDRVKELLWKVGALETLEPIRGFLAACLSGGVIEKKKADDETDMTTTDAPAIE